MIRILVKTAYIVLMFCILLASSAAFLVGTTPGLHTLVHLSQIYLPGTLKIHDLEGSLLGNFTASELEYQNKTIKISVAKVNVQWQPHSWLKHHFLTVQWHDLKGNNSKEYTLNSSQGTFTASATLPKLNLDLNSQIDISPQEHWQLRANMNGALPWQWTVEAHLTPQKANQQGNVHASVSISGIIKAKDQGNLLLTLSPGSYKIPDNNSIPAVQFTGGVLNFKLTPKQLAGQGIITIDPNKLLKLNLQLPQFALDSGLSEKQIINSSLTLELSSLDFLNNISPEITKLKGKVSAALSVKGTLGKPQIESTLLLSKASLYLPKLGLNLDSIDVNFLSKKKQWEITGSILSSGHDLQLKGQGSLKEGLTADLSLNGTNFPLIKTTEYQVNVSPQLNLHLTPTTHSLSGSVLIPFAQIKPQSFNNSVSLPDDVVYKKTKQDTPPAYELNSSMNIDIVMGNDVEISVKGLKGHLDGTLNLKQQPQGAVNAYGELTVRDGTYKAYGQDLDIQQGQLIFTGGPINNPGINVRAAKKINNTPSTFTSSTQLFDFNTGNLQSVNLGDSIVLGVEVTGRLTKPKIQLFSNPAILSQADILSMLVLGRPASQANKAGGQLLLAAISSMNVGGTNSTQLLEQLKQSSGLDFNVQTNTNYNQLTNTVNDSTAFVVGKSLSKRLYLSYNIGLTQTDTNMLTLKYVLNKFFSIQISNSDTSSAIDVLYTANKKIKSQKSKIHHKDKTDD